ncbi:MAG: hypothetical protein J0H11_02510 [Rhizobiales bacterium]|nr:hypothetical protein [Hyphomicrobiales bacterium]
MMKPAFLALAASLVLAGGSLVPTAASAQPYYGGGPGYGGPGWGAPHRGPGWHGGPGRYCKPIFRTVKVHGPYGWRWKTVPVGERCFYKPRYNW